MSQMILSIFTSFFINFNWCSHENVKMLHQKTTMQKYITSTKFIPSVIQKKKQQKSFLHGFPSNFCYSK